MSLTDDMRFQELLRKAQRHYDAGVPSQPSPLQDRSAMTEFSCNVRVISVTPQDFGALALIRYEQGGGIDIIPETPDGLIGVHITEDVQFVKAGAVLRLTLSDQPNV